MIVPRTCRTCTSVVALLTVSSTPVARAARCGRCCIRQFFFAFFRLKCQTGYTGNRSRASNRQRLAVLKSFAAKVQDQRKPWNKLARVSPLTPWSMVRLSCALQCKLACRILRGEATATARTILLYRTPRFLTTFIN